MDTQTFYTQLLENIDEAQIAINQPEVKKLLGDQILNTLIAALTEYRKATEEHRDFSLEHEAELAAAMEEIEEQDDQGKLAAEAAFEEKEPRLLLRNYELGENGSLRYEEPDDETPLWLPSPSELEAAEIELTARELEESQQAYRDMVEDETRALKSPRYFGNAINPIQWNWW